MDYRFVDCRPRDAYLAGHVPGAAHADPETISPAQTAAAGIRFRPPRLSPRGPPSPASARTRSSSAYDEGTGWAARLWWLLRHFGHDASAVIRLDAWHGPLRTDREQIERTNSLPARERTTSPARRSSSSGSRIPPSRSSTPAHPSGGAARSSRSIRSRGGFPAPATASSRTSRRYRRTCSTRTSSSSTAARASRPAPFCTSSTLQDAPTLGSIRARGASGTRSAPWRPARRRSPRAGARGAARSRTAARGRARARRPRARRAAAAARRAAGCEPAAPP